VLLLQQPHGFEGFGLVMKAIASNDQTVTKRIDVGAGGVDLDPVPATHAPTLNREHSPVRGLGHLLELDGHRLPGIGPILEELPNLVTATEPATATRSGRVKARDTGTNLGLGMQVLDGARAVAAG
jgi:hypothetical protein